MSSTKPPPRYNQAAYWNDGKRSIGTKATRANIIEALYTRKYITDERMIVTELGFDIVDVLHKHANNVISLKLTRDLEEKMDYIQSGDGKRESVLSEAIERLTPVLTKWNNKNKP